MHEHALIDTHTHTPLQTDTECMCTSAHTNAKLGHGWREEGRGKGEEGWGKGESGSRVTGREKAKGRKGER